MAPSPPAAPLADAARAILPWIVERRRHLHAHPELSFEERETSAFIEAELRAPGIEILATRVGGNWGLCAQIAGRDAGRIIGLRADIDALPIREENDVPFRSTREGVGHLCGHDAHTASLLGAARLLAERRAHLPATVRLFFQGAEEKIPGGAIDFVNAGLVDGLAAVYGLHVDPRLDVGSIEVLDGPSMAGVSNFTIHIDGRGGHAAHPELATDPIVAAAHVIVALQTIVSRRVDPLEPAVVSVTQINAGSASNIIPPTARLVGTVRSYRTDIDARFEPWLRTTVERTAAAHGCSARVEWLPGYPPVLNEPTAAARMRAAAAAYFDGSPSRASGLPDANATGGGVRATGQPSMGGEDFAHYLRRVPGAFGKFGVSRPGQTDRPMLHHPRLSVDEDALWRAAALLAHLGLEG